METKTCRVCNINKSVSEFRLRNDTNKYRGECNECKKAYMSQYNKTYVKGGKSKTDDDDTTRECNMCHKIKSIDAFELRADTGKRRCACRDCRQAYCRNYKNSEEYKAKERERRKTDISYRLESRLRARIGQLVSYAANDYKPTKMRKSIEFLGCSIEDLKKHLEVQFQSGMSWEDDKSFVLDHIIPCAWFDMSKPEHQDICFHYTNLQPLTALQNLQKTDKIEFQYITEQLWNRIPQELRNRLLSENNRKKRIIRSQAS